MAIAIALPGFNDLRRSVAPTFLSRNTLSKNEQKFNVTEVHGTSNPVILRLEGA